MLLIHGGLWEDMDAERFWHRPGIVAGLRARGIETLAPTRRRRAPDWRAEVDHLAGLLPATPLAVLAGSNGCSVAVRLALDLPGRVERLLLAWPATAGDPAVDSRIRADLGAPPVVVGALLAGGTLRGVSDEELASIDVPIGVLPSVPDNPFHQRYTVDRLRLLRPDAVALAGCPEPPRPDFAPHLESFLAAVDTFLRVPAVRLAIEDDVPALRSVAIEAYEHYVPRIGRTPAPMTADYAAAVRDRHAWLVTEPDSPQEILGFVVLVPRPDHLLLENVAVRPRAQGRGIGTRLLGMADLQARRHGLDEIRLYTNEAMTENLTYYPRHGYTRTHLAEEDGFRRAYFHKLLKPHLKPH